MKEITRHGIRYEYNEEENTLSSKELRITITDIINGYEEKVIDYIELLIVGNYYDVYFTENNTMKCASLITAASYLRDNKINNIKNKRH